jgi:hypothetical protein
VPVVYAGVHNWLLRRNQIRNMRWPTRNEPSAEQAS